MLDLENNFYSNEINLIAGCDEAGRGPIAGPLVVAACVLPRDFNNELINDSKKLTTRKREKAFNLIVENAIDYSIEIVSVFDIDKEANIYQTTKKAMIKCFKSLKCDVDLYLSDAMPMDDINGNKVISIIKGDSKSKNIAAASILAKVTRDRIMDEISEKYPEYLFNKHKGYYTLKHKEALLKYGPVEGIHRKSYEPIKSFLEK